MASNTKALVFGSDTETDNDGYKAWIVQWAISDGKNEVLGSDAETFKESILDIMKSDKSVVYFHNLKYDLSYIKYILNDLQKDGFIIEAMMRLGNPIYVKVSHPDTSIFHELTFRDSNKKIKGELKQLAKLVGMTKLKRFKLGLC